MTDSTLTRGGESGSVYKLETTNGSIIVADAVQASSHVLLQAGGTGSDLTQNAGADISTTGSGNISLLAQNSIEQNANVTTVGGTVDVEAFNGSISMGSGTETVSGGGNIRYASSGDVSIGLLNAGAGDVSVTGGDIAEVTSGTNVIADDLRLESTNGSIGSNGALDIQVTTLSSSSSANTSIYNSGDLTIDNTNGTINVNRVGLDSTIETIGDAAFTRSGTAGGSYTITTSGSLDLDGDGSAASIVSGGSQTYTYSQADNSADGGSRMNFKNNYTLTASNGDITMTASRPEILNSELNTKFDIDGDGAIDPVSLSPTTIISDGFDVEINAGGDFVMGQFEKLSVGSGTDSTGGNLTINASNAYVADVAVQGNLSINLDSGTLFIVERSPQAGFEEEGADIAVAGKLSFSGSSMQGTENGAIQEVIPVGGGEVDISFFAQGNNVLFGTLDPAELFIYGATFDNISNPIASLQFFPYVVNPQVFEVEQQEENVPEALRDELLKLRIFARDLSQEEETERRKKGYVYTPQIIVDELAPISAYEVAITRISAEIAQDAVNLAKDLIGEEGENITAISAAIGLAFEEFVESNPLGTPEDFAHHLSISTTPVAMEAFEYVDRFNQLFEKIENMGVTETELSISRRNILSRLKVDGLRGREMIEFFDSFVLAKETELTLSIQ